MDDGPITKVILVAEDNAINQFLVERMIARCGYSSRVAINGEELLVAYNESRPALILMDVQMPLMDGLSATREIRKLEAVSGERVPIIATTARALDGDAKACLDSGMDDYISKPIRYEILAAKLALWLAISEAA